MLQASAPPQDTENPGPAWTAEGEGQHILAEIRRDVEGPLLARIAELTRVLDETQAFLTTEVHRSKDVAHALQDARDAFRALQAEHAALQEAHVALEATVAAAKAKPRKPRAKKAENTPMLAPVLENPMLKDP